MNANDDDPTGLVALPPPSENATTAKPYPFHQKWASVLSPAAITGIKVLTCTVGNITTATTTYEDGSKTKVTTETVKPGEPFRVEMERTLERERWERADARIAAGEALAKAVESLIRALDDSGNPTEPCYGYVQDALNDYRSVK